MWSTVHACMLPVLWLVCRRCMRSCGFTWNARVGWHTVLYGRRGRCTRSCVSCLDKDHLSTTRDRSSDVSRRASACVWGLARVPVRQRVSAPGLPCYSITQTSLIGGGGLGNEGGHEMRCVVWCIQNWRSSASCALVNRSVSNAKTWPRCFADRRKQKDWGCVLSLCYLFSDRPRRARTRQRES